jgi:hypothetical protein
MQEIQLYINEERLDLFSDESVRLTQTIQNAKDIGSIFTDFSKSFSLPASETNNLIFKHFYNFNIDNGFVANDKLPGVIELNSIPFRKGFIALDGVDMRNEMPYAYKITFFGETVDLKAKLKDITLQNIFEGISTYDHDYNNANVKTGLSSSLFNTNIIYPLISHTERFYYDANTSIAGSRNLHFDTNGGGSGSHNQGVSFRDLKPAIKASTIIDRIETWTQEQFGLAGKIEFDKTATDSFFNTSNDIYDKMYLWLSRAKGILGRTYTGSSATRIPITDMTPQSGGGDWNPFCSSSFPTIPGLPPPFCDESSIDAGVWTVNPTFDGTSTTSPNGEYYDYRWEVTGSNGGTFNMIVEDVTGQTTVLKSLVNLDADGTTQHTIFGNNITNSKSIRFVIEATDATFTFTTGIRFIKVEHYNFQPQNVYNHTVTQVFPTGAVSRIVISDQMPKLKVLDFLTGLFKLFNLTAFVKEDGKIMVQTLDKYYETGQERDITEYIDITKSSVNYAPPYQDVAFRNQAPKTFFPTNFLELNNTTFGDLASSTNTPGVSSSDRGGRYVVQTPFSKFLYEKFPSTNIQWGWSVDKDQNPILDAPLLFIRVNTSTSTNRLSMQNANFNETKAVGLAAYNRPSNSRGTETINFGAEIDEFTGIVKTDSLFLKYYFNYISSIFNYKRRMVNFTARLPLKVLLNYTLADTFKIGDNIYQINSIETDLKTGESTLELFNKIFITT